MSEECGCYYEKTGAYSMCLTAKAYATQGLFHDLCEHVRDAVHRIDVANMPAPPSDEEIAVYVEDWIPVRAEDFTDGAKWMRDLMLQRRPQPEPSGAAPTDEELLTKYQEMAFDLTERLYVLGKEHEQVTAERDALLKAQGAAPRDACCGMSEGIGRTCDDCPDIVRPDRIGPAAPTDAEIEEAGRAFNSQMTGDHSVLGVFHAGVRWAWERASLPPAPAAVDLGDCATEFEAVFQGSRKILDLNWRGWEECWKYWTAKLFPTPPDPFDAIWEAHAGDYTDAGDIKRLAREFWLVGREEETT